MSNSKKIYLNKSDSVASAIDKVLKASDDEVVIYIPREAEVAATKQDLELLKREVEAAGKVFKVESVDEGILELVAALNIDANNPFLGRGRKTVSDIVVNKKKTRGSTKPKTSEKRRVKRRRDEEEVDDDEVLEDEPVEKSQSNKMRRFIIATAITAGVTALATFAIVALPRVDVALSLEKMEHGFIGTLVASPGIEESTVDDNTLRLRGVVFSGEKNLTRKYDANGTDSVGRKARGVITIYNDYSAEPQPLVATTRFVTPDGKLYRLDNDITVPGAEVAGDGTVTPSSIDAAVTADQPGSEYNIGPVPRFRIPGFQGSAKYEGFYGESKSAMTGGALGEVKVPTDSDLENARADARGALEDVLKSEFFVSLPDGIQVLEDAYEVAIVREQINDVVDDNGQFALTLYGEIKLIGFSEEELVDALRKRFEEQEGVDLQVYEYSADYGEVNVDFEEETLNSAISFSSQWTRPFNAETFKSEAVGMNENQLKEKIFSTPGVKSGQVKMWPFWVNKVPQDSERINVDAS